MVIFSEENEQNKKIEKIRRWKNVEDGKMWILIEVSKEQLISPSKQLKKNFFEYFSNSLNFLTVFNSFAQRRKKEQ